MERPQGAYPQPGGPPTPFELAFAPPPGPIALWIEEFGELLRIINVRELQQLFCGVQAPRLRMTSARPGLRVRRPVPRGPSHSSEPEKS